MRYLRCECWLCGSALGPHDLINLDEELEEDLPRSGYGVGARMCATEMIMSKMVMHMGM